MDAFVFEAVRTPRGRARKDGALAALRPIDLLAPLYRALRERARLDPDAVDDVLLGCVTAAGEQGANLAKISALYAGFGERASGVTVNRFCASGLDALNAAAAKISARMADLVVAGGVEAMSRVPMTSDGGAWFQDPDVAEKTGFVHMGVAADLLATLEGLGRGELEAYAARSHARAAAAIAEGRFARSIVPIATPSGVVLEDECVRRGLTAEKLAALAPAFAELGAGGHDAVARRRFPELEAVRHVHTAGTSPAQADGAALLLVGSAEVGRRLGLEPLARVVAFADHADDPVLMLAGNVAASRKALARAGLRPADVGVFEVNESFAATPLHFAKALEIDPERLNPNGGAIALGHPLGATGAVLVATAIDELARRGERHAVVSICAGAGIAAATVLERV